MEDYHVTIDVVAGVIIQGGHVLVCQRNTGDDVVGLWEFPGGKREVAETAEQCLVRECREELAIELDAGELLVSFPWPKTTALTLFFKFFLATIEHGEPCCLEHRALRWVSAYALDSLSFCPADASILPLVKRTLLSSPYE